MSRKESESAAKCRQEKKLRRTNRAPAAPRPARRPGARSRDDPDAIPGQLTRWGSIWAYERDGRHYVIGGGEVPHVLGRVQGARHEGTLDPRVAHSRSVFARELAAIAADRAKRDGLALEIARDLFFASMAIRFALARQVESQEKKTKEERK